MKNEYPEQVHALPVFLLVEAKVKHENRQQLPEHFATFLGLVRQYAGVLIANYDVEKTMDGGHSADGSSVRISVFSFPSRQAISQFFADSQYQSGQALRQQVFRDMRFHICHERI